MEEYFGNLVPLDYNDGYCAVQSNELIRSCQSDLSVNAFRVIRLILAQIAQSDTELLAYSVKADELAKYFGIDTRDMYRELRNIGGTLSQKSVYIDTGKRDKRGNKNYDIIPWLSLWRYRNGTLTVKINDQLKPYLIGLQGYFTSYPISQIKELDSVYAMRLFEVLYSYAWLKYNGGSDEIELSVDSLRITLDCKDKYSRPNDFIARVIEPACQQITEKALFPVTFTPVRKGHSYGVIKFKLDNWNAITEKRNENDE